MSSAKIACPSESYICKIPEQAKEVALKELREDDKIREQSLVQMREWIEKHPAIKKCRTDSPFLLRFLRTRKFSVPQACSLLERYLATRQIYSKWFQNLDYDYPAIMEIIDSGYLLPLPCRDSKNRQVIMANPSNFDATKFSPEDMARTHALICESLFDDELNQIYGYSYINDHAGLSMTHISMWSINDLRIMVNCLQNVSPMRHKETHFINTPSLAKHIMDFVMSLLNEKLRKRIMIHKSQDDLKEHFSTKVLPKEYGGEVPMADMIKELKTKLAAAKESILALDDMYIDLDGDYKLEGLMQEELGTGITGSFRKLEVD